MSLLRLYCLFLADQSVSVYSLFCVVVTRYSNWTSVVVCGFIRSRLLYECLARWELSSCWWCTINCCQSMDNAQYQYDVHTYKALVNGLWLCLRYTMITECHNFHKHRVVWPRNYSFYRNGNLANCLFGCL